MRERRPGQRRPLILLLSTATLLLVLCYIAFVASTTPSNKAGVLVMVQDSTPASQGVATQPSTLTPSCQDARTPQSGNTPLLDFCSPKYHGDISGPYGSHITLVGENFSSANVTWYVTAHPGGIDTNSGQVTDANALKKYAQNTCQPQSTKDCYPISSPITGSLTKPKASLFYWTWSKENGFPTNLDNFFFLAVIGTGNNITVISSSVSFTLTTQNAPCITVSYKPDPKKPTTKSSACNSTTPFSLSPGTTITIAGSNWLLQPPPTDNGQLPAIKVNISADCTSCNPTHIDLGSAAPDKNGKFSLQKTLPTNINGIYSITATSNAPTVAEPYQDPNKSGNTIVDDALTFGNSVAGDATLLPLQIGSIPPTPTLTITPTATHVPPIKTPTPCTNSCGATNDTMLDTFSLVAGVPALLSGLLLILVIVWQRFGAGRPTRTSAFPSTNGRHNNDGSFSSSPTRGEKSKGSMSNRKF